MKTRLVAFLVVSCLLGLAAWLVYVSNPALSVADPVPWLGDEPIAAALPEVPEKYQETLQKGLEYLVNHQFTDGHWEGDGGQHPVAMTGLAGLALLMDRDNSNGRRGKGGGAPKYSANIGKAVDWLMTQSQSGRDGLIFSEHASETARYMEGHGLATLFLAGACLYEPDSARRKKLTEVLARAVKYIVKAQSSQGGWYHTSKMEGHDFDVISATVIQIQALQAAENVGIPVPSQAISDAQAYLRKAMEKEAAPNQNRADQADTAAVLACRVRVPGSQSMDSKNWCEKWFTYCKTEIAVGRNVKFGRDELTHYYYAQALLERGREQGHEAWNEYRTAMFDNLQSSQNMDGSWPAGDGISVGRVYSTALWCIVLQIDRNSHPSTLRFYEPRL